MKSELEAGYLIELYNEPLYLLGYEYETVVIEQEATSENIVVKQMNTVVPKPETQPIPALPKSDAVSQKISKKCILLFLSEEDELSTKESEFLAKVMLAAKVQSGEYECINFRGITITDVASRYVFDKLVMFGVKIPNLEIGRYVCTQVKSTKIISADPVWMVETNNGLKKQLWEQLQVMFGLVK
jgi:hypothetical protein